MLCLLTAQLGYGYTYNFGYRVYQTDADLRVHHYYYDELAVQDYIVKNMAGNDSEAVKYEKAKELAHLVNIVSENFKIDPIFFLSLIRMESAFYYTNNLSNSGAVGLTQFVQAGLKEVFAQLGFLKDYNSTDKSRKFFENSYERTRNSFKGFYSTISFKELKSNLEKYNLSRGSDLRQFKSLFKNDRMIQIMFGAIFLKTLVARQCDKAGKTYCYDQSPYQSEAFNKKLVNFYRQALVAYNGEKKPISNCYHEGKNLKVEQNYMRFCYAAKIQNWAQSLSKIMANSFEVLRKKAGYIYINRAVDQFLKLNQLVDESLYHKRSFKSLKPSSNEGCSITSRDLEYTLDKETVDPLKKIYKQIRTYLVSSCRKETGKDILLKNKIEIEISYSFRDHYISKIELKSLVSDNKLSVDQSSLHTRLLSDISQFLEGHIYPRLDYVRTLQETYTVKERDSEHLFQVHVEALDSETLDYKNFETSFRYNHRSGYFTNFTTGPIRD